MPLEYRIQRLDDANVYEAFKRAENAGRAALQEVMEKNVEIGGRNHRINLDFATGLPWELDENELTNSKPGQYMINTALLKFELSSPQQGREPQVTSIVFQLSRINTEAPFDKFTLKESRSDPAIKTEGVASVLRAIQRELSSLLHPVAPEDGSLIPTLSNLAESFRISYQNISAELSEAVSKVNEERVQQINEFKEERQRLRAEIADERTNMLEAAQQEIDARKAELAAEEKRIAQERAQLEVSSHKDARRRQFQTLQDELNATMQQPVASGGLQLSRWAVFAGLILAGGTTGLLAYGSIVAGTSSADPGTGQWLLTALRSTLLTLASLASFYGAVAWLRYFYIRDLQAQEEMQRFKNDMARASWVMDAALEIRKEHDETIPPEWLAGVTEGLFASGQGRNMSDEAAQAIAALLGVSASAKVGSDGLEVDINKKGQRMFAKAAQQASER